ncbi:hypothetical protein Acsp03_55010 [Actinomadura sp. NBRC 104412]|nr:hypothetical protein Acsp03_55010 [Actinomadura sp. NBRC 104412]
MVSVQVADHSQSGYGALTFGHTHLMSRRAPPSPSARITLGETDQGSPAGYGLAHTSPSHPLAVLSWALLVTLSNGHCRYIAGPGLAEGEDPMLVGPVPGSAMETGPGGQRPE